MFESGPRHASKVNSGLARLWRERARRAPGSSAGPSGARLVVERGSERPSPTSLQPPPHEPRTGTKRALCMPGASAGMIVCQNGAVSAPYWHTMIAGWCERRIPAGMRCRSLGVARAERGLPSPGCATLPSPGARPQGARPQGGAACAPGRRGCVALTTGPATATVRTMRPICDGKSMLDGNKVDKNDPFVSVERGSSGKTRATYGIYMT